MIKNFFIRGVILNKNKKQKQKIKEHSINGQYDDLQNHW
jgi:hypothetical protein